MDWIINTPLFRLYVDNVQYTVNEYSIRNIQYLIASKKLDVEVKLEGRDEEGNNKVVKIQPDGRLDDYIVDIYGNQSMSLSSDLMLKTLKVQQ